MKPIHRMPIGSVEVTRWRLPNGLDAILAPDPAATSVCYMTWYRVGSRNENAAAGETGLAHLFEHLMFTQTKSARQEGEFDRRLEAVGANTNAATYYDYTSYVDNLPPDALPLTAGMEADRMVNLALRDRQVANERKVVAEERLGSVEDSVDGLLDEMMYGQAFERHPYRHPIIGLMKDIRAVTTEKAVRFYRTFYAPNNAVVVITGRFDLDAALALLRRHYGKLRVATLPPDMAHTERAPARNSRVEIRRPVLADRGVLGFAAPALAEPDRAAFEIIDQILTGGPSSRLYRRLVVDDALASSVDGSVPPTKDPGLYALWIQMVRGHRMEEAESAVDQELHRLTHRKIPAAELDKAKRQLEAGFWHGLGTSEGKAETLGLFEIAAGDYRVVLTRARQLARVQSADVLRVARKYFGDGHRSTVIARPEA